MTKNSQSKREKSCVTEGEGTAGSLGDKRKNCIKEKSKFERRDERTTATATVQELKGIEFD